MVEWVIDAAREAGVGRIVCVVRLGDGVAAGLFDIVEVAEQLEGEGTGAAVLAARDRVDPGLVVVFSGDHPFVSVEHFVGMVHSHVAAGGGVTIFIIDQLDFFGYGCIVRGSDGEFECIVETKYMEGVFFEELAIREVNLGSYVFEAFGLFEVFDGVGEESGERYFIDVFPVLVGGGEGIVIYVIEDPAVSLGVNDRADLMSVEDLVQCWILEEHVKRGVIVLYLGMIRVEVGVTIGVDITILFGVSLLGEMSVGVGCVIGLYVMLIDCWVGDGVMVFYFYVVEVIVHDCLSVGLFVYLRFGTVVGQGAKVGMFVEVKNLDIGAVVKVFYFLYIGDVDVGEGANLGVGMITANYDGRKKHCTKVGKSVKIGIHISFVVLVDVGDRVYIGAGLVIIDDVFEGVFGIA